MGPQVRDIAGHPLHRATRGAGYSPQGVEFARFLAARLHDLIASP
ncbi:hypothetical protein [Frankia sp. Cr2]|nr:hypothetical protein [Frankia sp. Cr2]